MDRRALTKQWNDLMDAIAPAGLTEREERALLEAKIIVAHVADAHAEDGQEMAYRLVVNGEEVPAGHTTPEDEARLREIIASKTPPGGPGKWDPKSTVYTTGRAMDQGEYADWCKANNVVETSKAEIKRNAQSESSALSKKEKEKILDRAIEQAKQRMHMIDNGQTPPPLESEARWNKAASTPREMPVEDLTDGEAPLPKEPPNIVEPGRGSNASVIPNTGEPIMSGEELDRALYQSINWK